uniref:TlpA family protein disulfide reductase n=1 Tax=candidate division WOR-3 bacterium TaxID=2052148 RepID=A0A7V3ZWV5_UNCW3
MKFKIFGAILLLIGILSAQQKKIAPDFTVTTIDGKMVSLSELRGKAVILDFWATWCPPCRKEIPGFVELKKKYGKKLEIIGISVDRSVNQVKEFYRKNKMNYPVAMATKEILESYNAIYRLQYIPTTFIIDKEGYIHDVKVGFVSKDEFEKLIQKLIVDEKK